MESLLPRRVKLGYVQAGSKVVEVDFIVVDTYSLYTAIVAGPWLHTLGAVSSTLHQKLKYLSGDRVEELVGNQTMVRQCLVFAILYQPAAESLAIVKEGLLQSMPSELPTRGPAEDAKCKDLEKFPIGDDPKKFFQLGAQLPS